MNNDTAVYPYHQGYYTTVYLQPHAVIIMWCYPTTIILYWWCPQQTGFMYTHCMLQDSYICSRYIGAIKIINEWQILVSTWVMTHIFCVSRCVPTHNSLVSATHSTLTAINNSSPLTWQQWLHHKGGTTCPVLPYRTTSSAWPETQAHPSTRLCADVCGGPHHSDLHQWGPEPVNNSEQVMASPTATNHEYTNWKWEGCNVLWKQ